MSLKLDYNSSQMGEKIGSAGQKFMTMLLMYATTKAPQIEAEIKSERPWTDRTGMAKAVMSAKVSQPSDSLVRITLAHGVDYGIWLELANEKNYAILAPTIKKEGPIIISDMSGMLDKLKL